MGKGVTSQRNPPAVELSVLILPCSPHNLNRVRDFVERTVQKLNLQEMDVLRLVAATDEAAMNAVDHGASLSSSMEFQVGVGNQDDCLIVLVRDAGGKPFDPEYFESLSQKKTWGVKGGRGILLISRAMDEVMYLFDAGKSTTVCMVKYLGGETASCPDA